MGKTQSCKHSHAHLTTHALII